MEELIVYDTFDSFCIFWFAILPLSPPHHLSPITSTHHTPAGIFHKAWHDQPGLSPSLDNPKVSYMTTAVSPYIQFYTYSCYELGNHSSQTSNVIILNINHHWSHQVSLTSGAMKRGVPQTVEETFGLSLSLPLSSLPATVDR